MWKLKSCPRCGGSTYIDEEVCQFYEKCLQCGYERALVKVSLKKTPPSTEKSDVGRYI